MRVMSFFRLLAGTSTTFLRAWMALRKRVK
jgi:hypothetical protein